MAISLDNTRHRILTMFSRIKRKHVTVLIMFMINLLNYMDRFTIAGIPQAVEKFYKIQDFEFGLLQTSFIASYMTFSLVFGYFGDRWKRKYLMLIGLVLWTSTTFISSFIPENHFWGFLFLRCLVGIGEASYSTIAPSILSDLFTDDARTKVLGLYYFAVPVGSGFGYVIGSLALTLTGNWKWALRITPAIGTCLIFITLFFHQDPPRGEAEKGTKLKVTSIKDDIAYLFKNKSFILISLMFTCVCFVIGSLTWWSVQLMQNAINAKDHDPVASLRYNIPLIFGGSVCFAGVIGVVAGVEMSRRFRKFNPRADVLVCIFGQLVGGPILFFTLISPTYNIWLCFFLVFLVNLLMCLQWAIVSDITMSIIIPTRRSMGNAIQTMATHLLGDAISPSIVGSISDALSYKDPSLEGMFYSLRNALFMTTFIAVLGGCFAMFLYFTVIEDKNAVKLIIEESKLAESPDSSDNEISGHNSNQDLVDPDNQAIRL